MYWGIAYPVVRCVFHLVYPVCNRAYSLHTGVRSLIVAIRDIRRRCWHGWVE